MAQYLRTAGEAGLLDLVQRLEARGEAARLTGLPDHEGFGYLCPQLRALRATEAGA